MYIFNKTWCLITLTCTNYFKYESIINNYKFNINNILPNNTNNTNNTNTNTNTNYILGGKPDTWSPTTLSLTNNTYNIYKFL